MSRKIILSTNHANTFAKWYRPTSIVSSAQELSDAVKGLPEYIIQIGGNKHLDYALLNLANVLHFNIFIRQDVYIDEDCKFRVTVYPYSRNGRGYDGAVIETSDVHAYPILMQRLLIEFNKSHEPVGIHPINDELLERMLFNNLELSIYTQESN